MKNNIGNVFKPAPSKGETKAERTTEAVRTILKTETKQRNAKTERLRAARLAREAEETPVAPAAKKPARRSARAS